MNEITTQAHATGAPGTLAEQVTQIQLDAWENEMPALERCIKESIRLVFAIIALRRNIEDPVTIDGKRINTGDFLAYFIHDTHLNDDIYPDAEKWNPDRWIDDQGVNSKKLAYPFLGWGVARFPCTGMRMAKVEMKTIVVCLVSRAVFLGRRRTHGSVLRSRARCLRPSSSSLWTRRATLSPRTRP